MLAQKGSILEFCGMRPRMPDSVFLAPGSFVIGDVELGEDASIWFNTVVRGDVHHIRIGKGSNIQDGSVCHVATDRFACILGDRVTVGHMVMLHGCTIGSGTLIGIGSVVLDDVEIGEECFVAAGSLITPGQKIPARSFVMGRPAKVVREVKQAEVDGVRLLSDRYVALARSYREGIPLPPELRAGPG